MGITDGVKRWLFGIALKKAVKRIVQLSLAWLSSEAVSKYGVDIQGNEEKVIASIYAALEVGRNWLKTKYPEKFGWL